MDVDERRDLEEVLAESENTLARLQVLIDRLNVFTTELTAHHAAGQET